MFARHPILSLATFSYLALLAWATLTPQSAPATTNVLWRLARFFGRFEATEWLTFSTLEFLANIALFVPLGLFFVLLFGRHRWWVAILIGIATTVLIEFAQQFIGGRISDPRDLVSNSIGAVVGTVLGLILTASKARRLRAAESRS
jgi:glycopeptide antibiotics resistance protein